MAQKRRLASRLGPLMGLKHDPIVVDLKKDDEKTIVIIFFAQIIFFVVGHLRNKSAISR